ncbi:IS4 family transposase [Haloferula rosea]|uniref:IS4 family transposase n=1 Tax=Haloferula rosea TaxID=490093 RepID=A0A934RD94_9BACT|nr:IS4 family transposase [Haloferula rosea]MBK1829072.1 IS4 family transposase [Haloferula rosea]
MRSRRHELAGLSPSGYGVIFEDILPTSFLASIDPTQRQRHFGHIPVLWAWVSQILEGNSSCSKALGFVQSWSADHGFPAPAGNTSAYCKARLRLSSEFIDSISRRVDAALQQAAGGPQLWHGLTLKAIDGSSVKLMDTEANQETFPQPSEQKKGCGFPVMSVSGMLNLSHGGWEAFTTGHNDEHDLKAAARLINYIGDGDLLLADRAYCSYRYLSKVLARGGHSVMRLHQAREKALDWRKGKRISPHERLVSWKRPMYSNVSQSMSRNEWEALPEKLEVRLIRLGYEDRHGRKRKMTVVTTLTDSERYDGIELHTLYASRWEIELRLRDIKTTLGFEMLKVRTPEMAVKTLGMIRLAYNLLRVLMLRSALREGVPVALVSFKGVLDLATTMHSGFKRDSGRPRRRARRLDLLLEMAARRRVDPRPFRSEPRAVKTRLKPFPLLNKPRSEFIEIPNRSTYRKVA